MEPKDALQFFKDIQPTVQFTALLAAAYFSFRFAKSLEAHKFTYRRKEIRYSKYYDKRMESLQLLDVQLGRLIQFTAALIKPFEVPPASHPPIDNREELKQVWKARCGRLDEVQLAINELQYERMIYIPKEENAKVTELRNMVVEVVQPYTLNMDLNLNPGWFYNEQFRGAESGLDRIKVLREKISDDFRKIILEDDETIE